jgi:hypothetical protein
MLAFMIASMVAASSTPAPMTEAPRFKGPALQCREIGSAASRSQALVVCRTKAQWQRAENCNGATRYCAPKKSQTAFTMNEDSRIVCRRLRVTGTRLSYQNTCLPQREWERMWKESAAHTLKLQDYSTTSPPGPR